MTPRTELHHLITTMLSNCRHALRIATEMQDQPLGGSLAEMERKLEAMEKVVRL